jgi:hypothetical protein
MVVVLAMVSLRPASNLITVIALSTDWWYFSVMTYVKKIFNTVVRRGDRLGIVVSVSVSDAGNTYGVEWEDAPGEVEPIDEGDAEVDFEASFMKLWDQYIELEKQWDEAKEEARICRMCFAGLRDLVVESGYQVLPHLASFQPLAATMSSLESMRREIRHRLDERYNRTKKRA